MSESGGGMGGSTSAGTLEIDVTARLEGFEQRMAQLERSAEETGERAGSKLGAALTTGLKVAAGAALGLAAALGAMVADGFQGVQEGQDAVAQLEAVIKSTGNVAGVSSEALQEFAGQIQETTKFTAEAVNATQSMLLTFTNIKAAGGVFDAATKTALDMAQALGGDAAQQAMQLGKALNDPIQGIAALSRVGVTFSEEQKKVIKSLVATGDTAAAQKLILAELNKEFGGSAEAAGKTFSGQMERLKNAFGEVEESVAIRLMPLAQNMANAFIEHLPQVQAVVDKTLGRVGKAFDFLSVNVFPVVGAALGVVKGAVSIVVEDFQKLSVWAERNKEVLIPLIAGLTTGAAAFGAYRLGVLAVTVAQTAWAAATGAATAATVALRAAMAFLLGPVGLAITAVTLLVTAGVALYRNWDDIKQKAGEIWEGVKKTVTDAVDKIVGGVRIYMDTVGGLFAAGRKALTGDWKGAWDDVQDTMKGAVSKVGNLTGIDIEAMSRAGGKLALRLLEGFRAELDTIQSIILSAISRAIDAVAAQLPSVLRGPFEQAAKAAAEAASRSAQAAAQHRATAAALGGTLPPVVGNSSGLVPNMTTDAQRYAYGYISRLKDVFVNDPKVDSDCASIASSIMKNLGQNIKRSVNAGELEQNALKAGYQKVSGDEIKAGDLIVWTSGNGKTYGAVSGKHVGVAAGYLNGKLQVINNPGSSNTVVEAMYDRQNAVAYRAPQSPFAAPVTQQPKVTNIPISGLPKVKESPEDARKAVEAQIKDILARVDLKLVTKDAAIKILAELDASATTTARKQGVGWQEYAASAKAAESAIASLKKVGGSLAESKDVLAALGTQYEYAGRTGLPAYVSGLTAFIAQQDKAAQSAKDGSKEQLAAMANVSRARKLLEDTQKASGLGLTPQDISTYRARAEEVMRLEKGMATSTDMEWRRRAQNRLDAYAALPPVAQKVLQLLKGQDQQEAESAKRRQAALEGVSQAVAEGRIKDAQRALESVRRTQTEELSSATLSADQKTRIYESSSGSILKAVYSLHAEEKRQADAAVSLWAKSEEAKALTATERDAEITRRRGVNRTAEREANLAAQREQASLLKAATDLQIQEGERAAAALSAQAQKTFELRYKLSADLVRYSYGQGDEGLYAALSSATGLSVDRVKGDIDAALAEATRLNSALAGIIKEAYAEPLKAHADAVAAAATEDARAVEMAGDARTQILEQYQSEQAAADDARITVKYLTSQIGELYAQGRDPSQSGFLDYLKKLAEGSGQAGAAAQEVINRFDALRLRFESDSGVTRLPDEAGRPERRPLALPEAPVAARGTAHPTVTVLDSTQARGALSEEAIAWSEKTKAQEYARQETEQYRLASTRLTIAQLESAKAAALASGNQVKYDVIVGIITDKTNAASAAGLLLAQAQDTVSASAGKTEQPNQKLIDGLVKLRAAAGVNQEALEGLIAALGELDTKAAQQQGMEKASAAINEWGNYAQRIIPVVTGAMQAIGGATSEVADQWGADLGSMTADLVTFATAIAKGDYVGAAIQALTTIFSWFSRNKKAAEEAAKATADYNNQFAFNDEGYKTRSVSTYTTGFLFWTTTHYKEQIDTLKRDIASSLEGGFINGIKDGFSKALAANDLSLFGKSLKENVGKAVLDGLQESFIKGAILKNILGPAIQTYLDTGDTSGLSAAVDKASAAGEKFFIDILAPVAEKFGLLGTDKSSMPAQKTDNPITSVSVTGLTASVNLDVLGTLATVVQTAAPLFSQGGRDSKAGGEAIVQGAGVLVAVADRLERYFSNLEAVPNGRW